jgi:L-lysine 2,3-aminomutase
MSRARIRPRRFFAYGPKTLESIPQIRHLSAEEILGMKAVSTVLPFRVNSYVTEELIDWENVPEDPIFQLTFPQIGMLDDSDF